LVIVALVGTDLHIRIFDASGKKVVDKAENELVSGEALAALKKQLTPIPDESGLSKEHKQKIIGDATSIAGHTHPDDPPAAETDRYSVLVALPLYLGPQRLGKEVSPEEVVGVFTLASNARDSGLLALVRQSDSVASGLRSRRPPRSPASAQQAAQPNIAAVAAHKIAQVISALLRRGEACRAPVSSRIEVDTLFTVALGYIRGLAAALERAAPRVEDRGKNPDNTGPAQVG
jgi:hypothetical protein